MRIWVTGIGVVSPLARGADATMDALVRGQRAIADMTLFDVSGMRSRCAAQVRGFQIEEVVAGAPTQGWSRTDGMAALAAREALAAAELPEDAEVDLVVGGTTAGMFETEELLAAMHVDPERRQPLTQMLSHPLSATADRLQAAVRRFRRASSICSACSSGANALVVAAAWLRAGRSDCVLAGGADGLCRVTYAGFSALGALSADPCKPFDVARDGLSLGEGAAFLLLETDVAARARGAEPIAELRGWAAGAEAHHITNPEGSGRVAAEVMQQALDRAQIAPTDVDYVNAHGTATKLNDAMEATALTRCFGRHPVAVSSSKGQVGHTLGAAGALEAAITAMAVQRGCVPPTMGLEELDPACALDHVRAARDVPIGAAMSNSFGFGGGDTVLVFAQPDRFDDIESEAPRAVFASAAGTVGPLGAGATSEAAAFVTEGELPSAGPIDFDAKDHLDLARARRVDRAGRLVAVAMGAALGAAEMVGEASGRFGVLVGEAYGAVDDCSAFVRRIYDKGPRFASPAVFPNLLPSSPAAHASIYHRLTGPVMSTADLGVTAESAIVTACELIATGVADGMLAGGVEQDSAVVAAVLRPLCSESVTGAVRSEGASVLLLESRASLEARGAVPIAEVSWTAGWRGDSVAALVGLPAPDGRAAVFAAQAGYAERLPLGPWAQSPVHSVAARVGDHEAVGGFAAAAALSYIAAGSLDCALVIGLARDRGYAMMLVT